MGRNYADATCETCGNSFQWLIGTPLMCPACHSKASQNKETKIRGKWKFLGGENYTIEDLGRPAIFFLPTKKLKQRMGNATVEENLHRFLIEHFGAYTSSTIPSFGFWKNMEEATISDECREYEVSFLGKERIPVLLKKLAEIAKIIEEKCIYVKAGQYSGLIYPS